MTACSARIFIGDDRYGGFTDTCNRSEPHDIEGRHEASRDGCYPPAVLVWYGTWEESNQGLLWDAKTGTYEWRPDV